MSVDRETCAGVDGDACALPRPAARGHLPAGPGTAGRALLGRAGAASVRGAGGGEGRAALPRCRRRAGWARSCGCGPWPCWVSTYASGSGRRSRSRPPPPTRSASPAASSRSTPARSPAVAAIEAAEEPDLVLFDLTMPGRAGLLRTHLSAGAVPRRAGLRRLGQRGPRHDPPLAWRWAPPASFRNPRRRRSSGRRSTAILAGGTWTPPGLDRRGRGGARTTRLAARLAQPDAAAAARADDDGGGARSTSRSRTRSASPRRR